MDLFGAKVVPVKELEERIKNDAKGRKGLEDVPLLLTVPRHHTSFKSALLFEGNAIISGDLEIKTDEKWLKKNQISMIACFGDLKIEGDLLNEDEHFWPLMFVSGDLNVCNILKGGMPLIVKESLNAGGYILGEFNDGPMRIGGDLKALGYIPLAKDRKEGKGHVVAGKIDAPIFDGRVEFESEDIHRVAVEEVLTYKWFSSWHVLKYGKEGKSIWRDAGNPYTPKEPVEKPPVPQLKGIDPTPFGSLQKPADMQEKLIAAIKEKIEFDPDRYSYPESFAEYVRIHMGRYPDEHVLLLPDGITLPGDLRLDWAAQWASKNSICAIACMGDLTINGTVRNSMLEGGPMLFVGGNLHVQNMLKAGAIVMVLGNLSADGLVIGEYNDGLTRVGGDLRAQYKIVLDHDFFVRGKVTAKELSDDDDLRDVMVESCFLDEDEYSPDVELIWAHHHAKRPLLVE